MSKNELSVVNQKIQSKELYFHPGVPVEVKLKHAFVTQHQTYIYPVFQDVAFLKKETAIVPKNRTANPLLRISETVIDNFYAEYRLRRKDKSKEANAQFAFSSVSSEEINTLRNYLPKSGKALLTIGAAKSDDLFNLKFGNEFETRVHLDTNIDRLNQVKNELDSEVLFVLGDSTHLPFESDMIDACFSFDPITSHDKETQKLIYAETKRILASNASSIFLFEEDKKLHTKVSVKTDQLNKKAKGFLTPWKKTKSAEIIFHSIKGSPKSDDGEILQKTSFGRQLQ